jgi:4-amino-4-deoxy-L-arabinose transferase-like glycosyltransferase
MNLSKIRVDGFFGLSVVLAAAGALAIAFLPWETVGAALLSLLLIGGTALALALLDSPAEERRFVVRLFLTALAVRLAAAALFYAWIGGDESYLYSDANTYDRVAWMLAQSWHGVAGSGAGGAGFVLDDIYPRLLAGLYFLIGHSTAAAILINIALGASAVYLVYRIGATLFGPVTARWAGWLAAFYTGFWLFEMTTLKDALSLFLTLLFFLGLYRLWDYLVVPDRSRERLLRAAAWIAALAVIFFVSGRLRNYLPVIFAGAVATAGVVEFLKAGRLWRWVLVVGSAAVIPILLWTKISAQALPNVALGSQSALFQITDVPETKSVGLFLQWILAHPVGFGKYLILSMFSTLLAPYAWLLPGTLPEVPRFETYMISYPGMWLWYLLIPFSLFGFLQAVRRSKGEVWPLVLYAAAVFLLVSIFTPREARHRDMIMPVALLLAAEGLVYSRRWSSVGLIVWIPLIGFIAWKMESVVPILLAVGIAAAVIVVWHIRIRRRRDVGLVRFG